MLSPNARKLILRFEGCDQPGESVGFDSGVTIGIGDDLGYTTIEGFKKRWQDKLAPADFARLITAIGKKKVGQEYCDQFKDIHIPLSSALDVFEKFNVPEAEEHCRKTFRGFDGLPEDTKGALVSLVYNRGTSMGNPKDPVDHDRRAEMRLIRDICEEADINADMNARCRAIAIALHSMERLWKNNVRSDGDLNDRRHAEGILAYPGYQCTHRK